MKFEEFEKEVWKKGYGIVAMNHYTIGGKRRTYCVVLSRDKGRAFQSEGGSSEEVFEDIYKRATEFEKKESGRGT